MTVSHLFSDTGYGLSGDVGDFRWNGHGFNPSAEDSAYQSFNPWTDSWAGVGLLTSTGSFNLSGYRYGNEVAVELVTWTSSSADSGYIYMDWYDPDNNLLFSTSWAWSHPSSGYWSGSWSGIGMKAGTANEIWKNGTYVISWQVTGQYNTISGDDYAVISNYGTQTRTFTPGYVWVEGTLLAFTCYQAGAKILCNHDGTSTLVGAAHAGKIWLETNGKITYVDQVGYKRSTKMGDEYGNYPDPWELPASGLTAYTGHIWVSNANYCDTYLCIISANGVKYRIGVGAIASLGDYQ